MGWRFILGTQVIGPTRYPLVDWCCQHSVHGFWTQEYPWKGCFFPTLWQYQENHGWWYLIHCYCSWSYSEWKVGNYKIQLV